MTWKMWNCENRNVEMEMAFQQHRQKVRDQKLCCVVLLDGLKLCYSKTTKRQRFPTQSDLILLEPKMAF